MASLQPSESLALPWHLHSHSHSQEVFSLAVQELRDVRPHLYSAAQYYEVAHLHSNHKKAVIESMKDYCAKALVNAVDHVGTVASQLNDSLSLCTAEISNVEVRTACVTQRLSTCHERTRCEGLRQSQQMRSRRPIYHKHYDPGAGKHSLSLLQLSPGKLAEIFQAEVGSDSNTLKSLSWYLAFESSSSATEKSVPKANRLTSLEYKNTSFPAQGQFLRSLSSGQTSTCTEAFDFVVKDSFSKTSNSLLSLMKSDAVEHKEETLMRKNPFVSIFGKNRSRKSKSFDFYKH
eukprot:c3428_g1_i1 orf=197-1066(+)